MGTFAPKKEICRPNSISKIFAYLSVQTEVAFQGVGSDLEITGSSVEKGNFSLILPTIKLPKLP